MTCFPSAGLGTGLALVLCSRLVNGSFLKCHYLDRLEAVGVWGFFNFFGQPLTLHDLDKGVFLFRSCHLRLVIPAVTAGLEIHLMKPKRWSSRVPLQGGGAQEYNLLSSVFPEIASQALGG